MEYPALDHDQIRLVLLKSGEEQSPIELSLLQNISLNTTPLYHAISYTWGDATDTTAISIDNHTVFVTKNLATCLPHLRRTIVETTPVSLWIDAICINQQDLAEKSVQIVLMRRIYEQSFRTIIWLGAESEDSRYAMELMEIWWDHERAKTHPKLMTWLRDERNAEWLKASWLACGSFGNRPWFLRAWVVQEGIVSTRTVAYCGTRRVALEVIATSLKALASSPPIRNQQEKIYVSLQNRAYPQLYHTFRTMVLSVYQLGHIIEGHARHSNGEVAGTLFELLWRHRNTGATNPLDKVYSLLGLLDNSGQKGVCGYSKELLVSDYTATIQEVFESVVIAVVTATKSLNILCASQYGMYDAFKSTNVKLPSWVSDWSKEWIEQDLLWGPWVNKSSGSRFCSAGNSDAEVEFDPGIMRAQGLIIDTIVEIWDELPFLKFANVPRPHEIDHIRKAKKWQQSGTSTAYPSPEGKADAHWHVLVANAGDNYENGPGDNWAEVYQDCMTEKSFANNNTLFSSRVNMVGMRRRLMLSETGYLAIGPDTAKLGDILCIIFGCDLPILLRSHGSCFELVGYVMFMELCRGR